MLVVWNLVIVKNGLKKIKHSLLLCCQKLEFELEFGNAKMIRQLNTCVKVRSLNRLALEFSPCLGFGGSVTMASLCFSLKDFWSDLFLLIHLNFNAFGYVNFEWPIIVSSLLV